MMLASDYRDAGPARLAFSLMCLCSLLAVALATEASAEIRRGLLIDRTTLNAVVIPDGAAGNGGAEADFASLESFVRTVSAPAHGSTGDLAAADLVAIRFAPGPTETVIRLATADLPEVREQLSGCRAIRRALLPDSVQTVEARFVYVEWDCGSLRPQVHVSVQISAGRVRRAFFHIGQALPLAGPGEPDRPMVRVIDEEAR